MQCRLKRLDLFLKIGDQLGARIHRNARNVIDGFVCIEFLALTADMRQRIDDMASNILKPQLEGLE